MTYTLYIKGCISGEIIKTLTLKKNSFDLDHIMRQIIDINDNYSYLLFFENKKYYYWIHNIENNSFTLNHKVNTFITFDKMYSSVSCSLLKTTLVDESIKRILPYVINHNYAPDYEDVYGERLYKMNYYMISEIPNIDYIIVNDEITTDYILSYCPLFIRYLEIHHPHFTSDYIISKIHINYKIIKYLFRDNKLPRYNTNPIIKNLINDHDFIKESYKINSFVFRYFQANKELVLELIKINSNIRVIDIPSELKQDIDIAKEIIKIDGKLFTDLIRNISYYINVQFNLIEDHQLLTNHEIILAAVKNGNTDYIVYKNFINDKILMLEVLKNDGLQFKNISPELQEDNEIMLSALKQNKQALDLINKDTLYKLVIENLTHSRNEP